MLKNTDAAAARTEVKGDAGFSIPGVDVTGGISMTGGTLEGYRRVLVLFCKDTAERLLRIADVPSEGDRNAFIIHVHALKGSAATIGVADLSREAAELEAAGKAGDMAVISAKLPAFCVHLKETTEKIGAALEEKPQDFSPENQNDAGVYDLFRELKNSLETKDMEAIDRITGELTNKALDKGTKETLDAISDLLLVSNFKAAGAKIDEFTDKQETGI
jgi:HPt (histidine-containing phosphotransfer) domain-containing protein